MNFLSKKTIRRTDYPFEALAEAIVKQALADYRKALELKKAEAVKEIEEFIKSDYFYLLINLDGDILIREMRRKFGGFKGVSEQSNIA